MNSDHVDDDLDMTFDLTTFAMQLIVVSFSLFLLPALLAFLLYALRLAVFLPDVLRGIGVSAPLLLIAGTLLFSFLLINPLKRYVTDVAQSYLGILALLQRASDPDEERDPPTATGEHLIALYGLSGMGIVVYAGVKLVVSTITDGRSVFYTITTQGYFTYQTVQAVLLDIVSLGSLTMALSTGLLAVIYTRQFVRRSGAIPWLRSRWIVRRLNQTFLGVWWEYVFRKR